MSAQIDVLVPIHTAQRPLARLVDSVLTGTRVRVRVLVICHGVDPASVRAAMAGAGASQDPRVTYLPFSDGVASPAGPLAFGLDQVTARYFTKVDSDDTLEPGALDAWLALAERAGGAGVVMPRMPGHGRVPTPPLRASRWRAGSRLDPLADRLAYRTSTMGLIRSDLAETARPTPGLITGEDIAPGLRLWFSGEPLIWAGRAPGYRVHHDGVARATEATGELADGLGFVSGLVQDPALAALDGRCRSAIAVKVLRVQVFGAIAGRAWLTPSDRSTLAAACRDLEAFAADLDALSRVDAELLALALDPASEDARLLAAARRRRSRSPGTLLPRHLSAWRNPEGAGRIDAAFAAGMVGQALRVR